MFTSAIPFFKMQFCEGNDEKPEWKDDGEDFPFPSIRPVSSNTFKIQASCAVLEIIICIGAVLAGYLIHTNSLPVPLQFLKGQFNLATGLTTFGIIDLFTTSICLAIANLN